MSGCSGRGRGKTHPAARRLVQPEVYCPVYNPLPKVIPRRGLSRNPTAAGGARGQLEEAVLPGDSRKTKKRAQSDAWSLAGVTAIFTIVREVTSR